MPARSLLKPGGQAFFATINRNPKSFLFAIIGAEYVLRLLPRGTHEYAKTHPALGAVRLCRRAGLTVEGIDRHDIQPAHARLRARQRTRT